MKKGKLKKYAVIIIAWAIALMMVYYVYIKAKILFNL